MITKSANGSQFYGSIYRDTICILFWIRAFLWENGYDLGLFKTAQSNNICKISERSRFHELLIVRSGTEREAPRNTVIQVPKRINLMM